MEYHAEGFLISTDKQKLDLAYIHHYLCHESYWASGIPVETVARSIEHSLCFGIYKEEQQVGFARMITDRATFAYMADVFVDERCRGRGLGKWLVECMLQHPDLQGLRRLMLATRDAHGLYTQYGFTPLTHPERFMQQAFPDIYKKR